MLLPGIRLVDRPGVLHFFDGRRVVSLRGDDDARAAVRAAVTEPVVTEPGVTEPGPADEPADADLAREDARRLVARLALVDAGGDDGLSSGARYAAAAVGGWAGSTDIARRLADTVVHVWADPSGRELCPALRASGLNARPISGPAAIPALDPARSVVLAPADDEAPVGRLRALNTACLATGVPWLPIGAYDGARLPVGPLFLPGDTACFECLQRRLAANVAYAEAYPDVVDAPAAPTPPALRRWAESVATLLLIHWIGLRDARVPGRLAMVVPDELAVRTAEVLPVPRCPACQAPDYLPAAAPWGPDRDH